MCENVWKKWNKCVKCPRRKYANETKMKNDRWFSWNVIDMRDIEIIQCSFNDHSMIIHTLFWQTWKRQNHSTPLPFLGKLYFLYRQDLHIDRSWSINGILFLSTVSQHWCDIGLSVRPGHWSLKPSLRQPASIPVIPQWLPVTKLRGSGFSASVETSSPCHDMPWKWERTIVLRQVQRKDFGFLVFSPK